MNQPHTLKNVPQLGESDFEIRNRFALSFLMLQVTVANKAAQVLELTNIYKEAAIVIEKDELLPAGSVREISDSFRILEGEMRNAWEMAIKDMDDLELECALEEIAEFKNRSIS